MPEYFPVKLTGWILILDFRLTILDLPQSKPIFNHIKGLRIEEI